MSLLRIHQARFAIFLTFRDDRIAAQHDYDCFDPSGPILGFFSNGPASGDVG